MKRINNNTSIASHNGVTGMRDYYLASIARTGFIVLALTLVMVFLPREGSAQSVTVTGKVTDVQTGQPLPGAKVDIESAGISETADDNGRFVLRRVPSGNHTLAIHYLGYESEDVSVSVSGGQLLEQDVELQSGSPEGDKIFVRADHWGQSRALNSQFRSAAIKSTITSEQMDRFTDYTINDAIIRVPGVQAGARGEISIRGIGVDRYKVTMDGQYMPSTTFGSRSVDLDMMASGLVRDAEVIKVVTPDMNADAMTGVINLNTYNPVGEQRTIDIRLGGGANTQYFNVTGPERNASIYYSEPVSDQFAFAINLNYQQNFRSWESLGINYQVNDFEDGEGPVDVLERVAPSMYNDGRSTTGGSLQLTYQPTFKDSYYIRTFINNDDREIVQNITSYSTNGNWDDAASTSQGIFQSNLNVRDITTQQYMVHAGGNHLFDVMNLEYNLGWTRSNLNEEYISMPFVMTGQSFSINMDDRERPFMQFDDSTTPQASDMNIQTFRNVEAVQIDNSFTGSFDIEVPFGIGSFKLGSHAQRKVNDTNDLGAYTEFLMTYRGFLFLNSFNLDNAENDILGQYSLPWRINPQGVKSFVSVNSPILGRDLEKYHSDSDYKNYNISENIYAGYGMATFEFGNFTLLGGARMEYTDLEMGGRLIDYEQFGRYTQTVDSVRTRNHTNIFPNAQLIFTPQNNTKISLAYSKTMERPDYQMLSPFELANRRDTTIFHADPLLEPAISNNFDLHLDHFLVDIGVASVGLFYKEVIDIMAFENRVIEVDSGDYAGLNPMFSDDVTVIPVNETIYRNLDETATIYGVELSWQQKLSFLPGFLGNLGTFANYTWSESKFESKDRPEDVTLPYQSPHVVNAAVDYTQGRLFTQISYHWTAESLSSLGSLGLAPSLGGSESVYLDRYQDGWSDLSVSIRFRVSDNFRIWADAFNLLGKERVLYQHTREYYPTQIDKIAQRSFRAGIRFDL